MEAKTNDDIDIGMRSAYQELTHIPTVVDATKEWAKP
jgi:hypothetical protein